MDIVRPEMAALGHVICFRRSRKGRNADGVGAVAIVEHPDQLQAVLLVVEHRFVEHDEQLAVRQRQAIVRAAAERRAPVAVDDELRLSRSAMSSTTMPASRQAA